MSMPTLIFPFVPKHTMNNFVIILPGAFVFLILPTLLPFVVQAQLTSSQCIGSGNYTSTSQYKANLDAVLSSLPPNIDRNGNGFYNASAGQNPDRANAVVLCRGDVDLDSCRTCVRDASLQVRSSCPSQKQAIIWYNDNKCMLRYSNETIFGTLATTPTLCFNNSINSTSPELFQGDLRTLLDDLRSKAVNSGSQRKFAAGNITGPVSQSIFALVQCTPDLNANDCDNCLRGAATEIGHCSDSKIGGRILEPSCSIRYEIYSFFNAEVARDGLVLGSPPSVPSKTGKGDAKKAPTIAIAVVSIAVCVILAVIVGILIRKKRKRKPLLQLETMGELSTIESLQYSFSTIRAATNDFSNDNKLGEGGFGAVYKGILPNGQEIAVKRLSKESGQGVLEFKNEVFLLAKLLHRNLVKLLGFCHEGNEKLLAYEYVPNGSLDHFIFDPTNRSHLDWDKRQEIIRGIARGLLYLHEGSQLRIIHRDLKASNVLLSSKMVPKIADFGLAKLFEQEETQGKTSRIAGTYGYMAPEYAMHGKFSVKSDVFSFGVLVLEIISGKKDAHVRNEKSALNLMSFAWKNWRDGTSVDIVDSFLRADSSSMNEILRCIQIGLLCVQQSATNRPTMASVVEMLSGVSIYVAAPSHPAFYFGSDGDGSTVSSLHDDDSRKGDISAAYSSASKNEVSITELQPR